MRGNDLPRCRMCDNTEEWHATHRPRHTYDPSPSRIQLGLPSETEKIRQLEHQNQLLREERAALVLKRDEEVDELQKLLVMVMEWHEWGAAIGELHKNPVVKRAYAAHPATKETSGA